jgi:2-oxoglutarate dehydrogenase E2 component (dihydrolipoamide succinyltransferase)
MVEMKVPSPGESITEVQISSWLKKDGDYVEKDEELCEIDSDKATLTLNAEASGVLKILVKEGETVQVGAVVCTIDDSGKKAAVSSSSKQDEKATEAEKKSEQKPEKKEEPVAEKKELRQAQLPEQKKAEVRQTQPTVEKERLRQAQPPEPKVEAKSQKQELKPSGSEGRTVRRQKMTMLRKKVSQRLVAVKQETAMLTTFNEVDMSAIMNLRNQYKDVFLEKHKVKLGFMSFFTKAVCEALKNFPAVNAQIDGDEIIFHDYCDIGIAVSAPKGLMVPVLRNAERLTFAEIESKIGELAGKAREAKLSIEEMSDGTFTITNGGVFGSMLSTPIINPPQSAILGMHNIVERPVAVNKRPEIRPIMYVALSYDHRIIDGKESVSFLVNVKQLLEDPLKMFLKEMIG